MPYPQGSVARKKRKGYGKPYPYNQAVPRDHCQELNVTAQLRKGPRCMGFSPTGRDNGLWVYDKFVSPFAKLPIK